MPADESKPVPAPHPRGGPGWSPHASPALASPPPVAEAAGPDDEGVLALADAGDRRGALALLMRDHGAAVFARAVRLVHDRSLAEDVLQQTFLAAHRDLPGFRRRSTLRTWLVSIATHRALDALRARRREANRATPDTVLAAMPSAARLPGDELETARRVAAIEECLGDLSPDSRAAVLMRFQSEQSYDEMATALGEKPGTLQARVARALPALRRCLETKGVAP